MIRLDVNTARDVMNALRQGEQTEHTVRALTLINDQLDRPNWGGDMVDKIAGYLTRVNTRNIMGGEALRALRQSLLSPREFAKAEADMRKGLSCVQCARTIGEGEFGTVHHGEVWCSTCLHPSVTHCTGCDAKLPFDVVAKLTRARRDCKQCKDIKEGKVKPTVDAAAAEDARMGVVANATPQAVGRVPFAQRPAQMPRVAEPRHAGLGGEVRLGRLGDRPERDPINWAAEAAREQIERERREREIAEQERVHLLAAQRVAALEDRIAQLPPMEVAAAENAQGLMEALLQQEIVLDNAALNRVIDVDELLEDDFDED